MKNAQWDAAQPVMAMDWEELTRWSERVRKLAHDVNNALVPAFAHTDLLRLKLGHHADLTQLNRLPTQLELARATAQRAVSWIVRPPAAVQPAMKSVQLELMMQCRQASVAFSWDDHADANAQAAWSTSDARHVLRALIRNSCEATETTTSPSVAVEFHAVGDAVHVRVTDNGPGCTDIAAAANNRLVRHGHGHLGLGLTSAATVAARHGAELRIDNGTSDGFVAMLRVPRRTAAQA